MDALDSALHLFGGAGRARREEGVEFGSIRTFLSHW